MADTAFGPHPDRGVRQVETAYLDLVRRRRMYGGILLIVFAAMMAAGFDLAQSRNAGRFIDGLPMVLSFPSEVISEAWAKRANIPAMLAEHLPSLVETVNIAAVSTLLGGLAAMVLALLSTRGLAR